MKVCEICGDEIATRDGDNQCNSCEAAADEKKQSQLASARKQRRSRDEAMRSIGMVKVRGALGGTYWE